MESQNYQTRYGETKKVQESTLYDGYNHTLLTILESLLKMNPKELTQCYTFTDISLKNYFGLKLITSIHTNVSEIETDTPVKSRSEYWPK